MVNLAQIFLERAARQPDHPLILGPGEDTRIDYGAFAESVQALAAALRAHGVEPGMNIGLHLPSGAEYIRYTYALWACQACVTPIPVELADEEKRRIFEYIHIDAVITSSRQRSAIAPAPIGEPATLDETTRLTFVARQRPAPPELDALNPAFIRFTSGTTGDAKGVVLSHDTILERIQAANQGLAIGPRDRVLWLLSMAYHFAVSIVAYLSFGATILLPKSAFGVSLLQAANRHRATIIYGAPTHYELMTHDRDQGLPPLRLAIVTTARLGSELAEAFYRRFAIPLNETYGIIELGLPAVNLARPRDKQGSVGRLLPDYELKLARRDDCDAAEILLRGPGMLDAYYDPWQRREQLLEKHHGWLATGDLGVVDDEGFLTIVGRGKELISVSGMKFFPQEVERVLEDHPAVEAACVFGVPNPRMGELPAAHLVASEGHAKPGEDELKAYCAKHLASYKIPDSLRWVDRLAYTASGKLIRNADKLLNP
jgi:long-chain acyl-CoA synthetase